MTCPGSVVLSEGMPERTSEFAQEGTDAHALAEAMLRVHMIDADVADIDEANAHIAARPKDMRDYVRIYADYVLRLGLCYLNVEQRVKVNAEIYGTADAVVWQPNDKHLHVVDLKYGAGVPVEVHGNLQLKIYALATLLSFSYPAQRVTATICQPRCPHPDGPIRSVTYDVVDLLDFHADLLDAARVVRDAIAHGPDNVQAGGFLVPSEKGCRWCLAAPKCPALKAKAQDLAKTVFAPGEAYDAQELARTLDFLPILEGWIKNVREFAYTEAEKGVVIPDWKLVEKRASRKWRDETAAAKALNAAGVECWEKKLITPAVAEKALLKDQRGLLDELTIKESSGHTLVHASDKRPAVQLDAKSAFATS